MHGISRAWTPNQRGLVSDVGLCTTVCSIMFYWNIYQYVPKTNNGVVTVLCHWNKQKKKKFLHSNCVAGLHSNVVLNVHVFSNCTIGVYVLRFFFFSKIFYFFFFFPPKVTKGGIDENWRVSPAKLILSDGLNQQLCLLKCMSGQ